MLCASFSSTASRRPQRRPFLDVLATIVILAFVGLAAAAPLAAQTPQGEPDNSACTACHDDVHPTGAHASVACASCHAKHEEQPHPEGLPKPECAQCHAENGREFSLGVHGVALKQGKTAPECATCHGAAHTVEPPNSFAFKQKLPETCSTCHDDVGAQFAASVHGTKLAQGMADAPMCTSCHGEHAIRKASDPASSVNALHVRETCGQCHGNVQLARRHGIPSDRLASFDESFHGLALKAGSPTVANCASCHGVHDILPSSNPASKTNVKNLSATCGRCHEGAGKSYAIGRVHLAMGETEPVGVTWVRWFYWILIPLTLGLMLVHNLGDWIRKLIRARRGTPRPVAVARHRSFRMYPLERLQHVGLAVSFIVLAWSGFALEYPERWWALPLTGFEGAEIRRNIHRVAAVVFIVVSIVHVLLLLTNTQLREHWKLMLPKWRDFPDAAKQFAYNIGLRKTAPKIPALSYIEKAEYWAVVWGGVLMTITGLVLWANNLAMQYLPKEWLDVATAIHWFEAILAAAAIVIWHFYGVIFDPDVYPLDTAFITGFSVREHDDPTPEGAVAMSADPDPGVSPQSHGLTERPAS